MTWLIERTAKARNTRLHQLREAFYENAAEELRHSETHWELSDFLERPDVDPATKIKVNNASKIDTNIRTVVERTAVDENGRPIPEIATKLILRNTFEN